MFMIKYKLIFKYVELNDDIIYNKTEEKNFMKKNLTIFTLFILLFALLFFAIGIQNQADTLDSLSPADSDLNSDSSITSLSETDSPEVLIRIVPPDEGFSAPEKGSAININYISDNDKTGKIEGKTEQQIKFGETVTAEVKAVPELGWKFLNWSDGSTNPVRVGDSYKTDATLTAYFVHDKLNMPVLSISTGGRNIGDSYERVELSMSYINPDLTRNYQAQMHVRGANSRSYQKLSYKIRLDDRYYPIDITKRIRGNRHYVLIAVWNDYSLMRTPMGLDLMSQFEGIPYSPNYTYVEVYFDDVYWGVYLLAEQIRVDENRVNIDDSNTGDTNSFLVSSAPGRDLQLTYSPDYTGGYYGVSSDSTFGNMRVKSEVHNQEQLVFIKATLKTAWNSIPDKKSAEQYFDIASLVDVYIAAEIMKGLDIAWNNHFWMHYDESTGKVYFTTLWDLKFGGGNHSGHNGFWAKYEGLGMIAAQGQWGQYNRWFIELMKQTWFRELVQKRFAEIDNILNSIVPSIWANYDLHRVSFERNFVRWPKGNIGTDSNFTPKQVVALKNHEENASYLVNWMENRISWLRKYIGSSDFIKHAGTDNPG